MAAITLTPASVVTLKKSLRNEFPDVKSSHITEALAHSLGFRTHAAMLAALVLPSNDPPFALLSTEKMLASLQNFGYPPDPEFDFEFLMQPASTVVSTVPISAYDIEYKSLRQKAWRNLMVSAINAALEQKLFSLRPGDNRFSSDDHGARLFDFALPNGLPCRASVRDAGHDELAVHAAVNPKGDSVRAWNAEFTAGDAFGTTWLERQRGAWMQSSDSSFHCRKALLPELAAVDVEPSGYGDRGGVIM